MRKRGAAAQENHDRWLVSYADFITLLFAFFVVMFATSQADKGKARTVSESVRNALKNGPFAEALSGVLGRGKPAPGKPEARSAGENAAEPPVPLPYHPADLQKSMATLAEKLDKELEAGKIQLRLEGRGLVISLREATFFASGDDAVEPASFPTLAKIAVVVRDLPNPIRLEGYTDSVPIHNSRFRSNWELSAARSIAMLELMQERYHIPPERMAIAGYAENAPSDTNGTAEGRAHNRRVELVVLSAEAIRSEPQPAAGAR